MRLAALVIAIMLPSVALAQPTLPEVKSESTATGLAVIGPLGGIGLIATSAATDQVGVGLAGLVLFAIGPSLGHVYAGAYKHAAISSGLRALGLAAMSVLLAAVGDSEGDPSDVAVGVGITGVFVIIGTTAVDIMTADNAARAANARAFSIAPTVVPSASGGLAPGLAVRGRF
jgi:hypothetical protein